GGPRGLRRSCHLLHRGPGRGGLARSGREAWWYESDGTRDDDGGADHRPLQRPRGTPRRPGAEPVAAAHRTSRDARPEGDSGTFAARAHAERPRRPPPRGLFGTFGAEHEGRARHLIGAGPARLALRAFGLFVAGAGGLPRAGLLDLRGELLELLGEGRAEAL